MSELFTTRIVRAPWPGVLLFATLLTAAGCGSGKPVGEVKGSVSVDGKAVSAGSIAFIPVEGNSQTAGGEIKGGQYMVRAPIGSVKVEIRAPVVAGQKKLYNTADSPSYPIMKESLPTKFHDDTELRFEVKAGDNEKNWDLKTK